MTIPRVAVYPGSFDPITRGHEDLVRRAFTFADKVVVAVAVNVAKQPLFTLDERVALIKQAITEPRLEVRAFDGLLAEFARMVGASVIVRGLRAVSDFEYEFQMALMNRNLAPGVETVFLVPAFDLTYLSSSLVREVARFGGDDPRVRAAAARIDTLKLGSVQLLEGTAPRSLLPECMRLLRSRRPDKFPTDAAAHHHIGETSAHEAGAVGERVLERGAGGGTF